MTINRVQLDISSDIFDKFISFLEILPQNKIKLTRQDTIYIDKIDSFNPKDFFGITDKSKKDIDEYLDSSKNQWNNYINE